MLKRSFTQKPEKSVEGKPYSRNTVKANLFQAGQTDKDKSVQAGKRSSRSITKRSCATEIDFFHKAEASNFQRRLEILYAANQLGLNAPESFANLGGMV